MISARASSVSIFHGTPPGIANDTRRGQGLSGVSSRITSFAAEACGYSLSGALTPLCVEVWLPSVT